LVDGYTFLWTETQTKNLFSANFYKKQKHLTQAFEIYGNRLQLYAKLNCIRIVQFVKHILEYYNSTKLPRYVCYN